MSVPVTVDFPVAFNAIRKGGRKEEVLIAKVTVATELETLADPWHNAYPYSCYSFSELDVAVSMASTLNRKFDRQALFERIDIREPGPLTPTFVERRIALLSNWFLKRLPEFLSARDQIEAGHFVATLPRADQERLSAVCDAARKTNQGLIDADVLNTAEQLLYLSGTSQLKHVLDQTEDAHPMIEVLRAELEDRPVSINLWRRASSTN